MFFELLTPRVANVGAISLTLVILTALWLRYTAKWERFAAYKKGDNAKDAPLTFPYPIPLLGTLPLAYLWKPREFVLSPNHFFQCAHPVLVKILHQEFYVVRGAENVKALFKNSWACTSVPFVKFALSYAFDLPAEAQRLYDKDDSGGRHVPHPDSKVEARNRVDYRGHQSMLRFLEGKGLLPFWNRFADNFAHQLHELHGRVGTEWSHRPDLIKLVDEESTVSIINALCGPYMLSLNPTFLQDYWAFDQNLQTYLQGLPWFLAPRAYLARRRVLNAVKIWQRHAREHCNGSDMTSDTDDQFWGSSFFRERDAMFLEMDGFDGDAVASENFGAMWAARNAISASSWTIYQLYRDPELLASVRAEVDSCATKSADGRIQFDVDQLLRLPLLQAVYAETLRLRMHFYIIRMPDRVDMDLRDWIIPRQKVIVTLTTVAHMEPQAWDTGVNNEHPVDQFWAGRFLKYSPADGSSNAEPREPTFSTKDLEGTWIPYGGGPRQCPGRHFAKRQIMFATAMMISLFDCEILEEGRNLQEDFSLNGFGSGISHPVGKVPVRIRQRN